jgi:hypothetical protein
MEQARIELGLFRRAVQGGYRELTGLDGGGHVVQIARGHLLLVEHVT